MGMQHHIHAAMLLVVTAMMTLIQFNVSKAEEMYQQKLVRIDLAVMFPV
jgi:hypothetical protein